MCVHWTKILSIKNKVPGIISFQELVSLKKNILRLQKNCSMAKRLRTYKTPKAARPKKRARTGYSTVPRTRGVYAKGEMKYFSSAREATNILGGNDWAGANVDPNAIPVANINTIFAPTQGSGINQRIGKACKIYKIKIRGHVNCAPEVNQTTGANPADIRVLLVQDLQTNGTQAAGNLVMETVAANALLNVDAFQNIDNFGRFRVLKDKSFILEDPNMTAVSATEHNTNGLTKRFKWNITFRKPIQVRFNATNGGTIADIVDNSFHMYAYASSTSGLAPYISYNCRICFKE